MVIAEIDISVSSKWVDEFLPPLYHPTLSVFSTSFNPWPAGSAKPFTGTSSFEPGFPSSVTSKIIFPVTFPS